MVKLDNGRTHHLIEDDFEIVTNSFPYNGEWWWIVTNVDGYQVPRDARVIVANL